MINYPSHQITLKRCSMAYPKYHIQTQLMLVLTKNTYSEGWWLFFPPVLANEHRRYRHSQKLHMLGLSGC